MKNLFLLSAIALGLLASGCAKSDKQGEPESRQIIQGKGFPNEAGSVFGKWDLGATVELDGVVHKTILIGKNKVGLIAKCEIRGKIIKVGAKAKAVITENSISILKSASRLKEVKRGLLTYACNANLDAAHFTYELMGDRLKLTNIYGGSSTLPRVP